MPTRLTALLVALLATLCVTSSADALTIGIADQKPDMFSDGRFLSSDLHYARRAIPWDTLTSPTQTAALDAWLAAAHAAHVNPLLSFTHSSSNRRQLPTPERLLYEFRRLRARYPWVTDYASWNEANHCGEPTCHRPELVAAYWRKLRARVPDVPDPRRRGPRHAQHDLVGEGLPPRGEGRAALLGPAQLHRRQPAAHDRHAPAAEDGARPGVVHRDGRDRLAHEPPQGDLPRVRRARGDGDALPLRRARPAQPAHHARLRLPVELLRGAQDVGLRADRPQRQAAAGVPGAAARARGAGRPQARRFADTGLRRDVSVHIHGENGPAGPSSWAVRGCRSPASASGHGRSGAPAGGTRGARRTTRSRSPRSATPSRSASTGSTRRRSTGSGTPRTSSAVRSRASTSARTCSRRRRCWTAATAASGTTSSATRCCARSRRASRACASTPSTSTRSTGPIPTRTSRRPGPRSPSSRRRGSCATSACRTSTSPSCAAPRPSRRSRRCSRPTRCSSAPSRTRSCPSPRARGSA